MQQPSDAQWLRDYAAHGSEPAFAALVARHTDLVYSAALRQTGSPELAREIAQSVFTDLARKASRLAPEASLAGWLYRGTRFATLTRLRDERRRASHERQFMEHFHPAAGAANPGSTAAAESAPDWQQVAPVLDEAMAELGDADREAVVLRYFQNQDFQAVARALGVSEAAAQKRVSRAVERLREALAQRGVTTGAQGLVVLIAAQAVLVAPAGLSAALATAALAGTTLITAAAATVGKAMAMSTLQKTLITAVLAAAVGFGIYEANQASTERAKLAAFAQQQHTLSNQLDQLAQERDAAARQLAVLRNSAAESNRAPAELLRLRGEVGVLRQQLADLNRRPTTRPGYATNPLANWPVGDFKLVAQMRKVGLSSPEAAIQTYWAALRDGDATQLMQCMILDDVPGQPLISDFYARREVHSESMLYSTNKERAFFLTSVALNQSRAEVTYGVGAQSWPRRTAPTEPRGEPKWVPVREGKLQLVQVGTEWKVAVSSHRLRINLDDFDPEATADGLLQMTAEQFRNLNSTIPPKTRQAYEEMKAKVGK